ncbi:hypothetical protein P154DRAFT_581219 [Amniculicola lignicola CBS 123094]|uniref:Aminoglycoside phosphotransferase domain-containing protein n=1 Tax=Amniculicola lignicola CBS 123094 TaxID=1392246 RepID=A0A6A5W1B7_9PLEO|nr:hypothetical protein P154DRAFT_581219 [Amniculicola lignicola CBS 123094]
MISSAEFLTQHFGTTDIFKCLEQNWDRLRQSWYQNGRTQFSSLTLPYYAPGIYDPPLPSTSDIITAQGTPLNSIKTVHRILERYIVKSSPSFSILMEAENLIFLERHSNVKIPKLYAVFSDDKVDSQGTKVTTYYLVTEYIKGVHLDDDLYKSLDDSLKAKAGSALGVQLQALCAVPSQGYYGYVNKQGWPPTDQFVNGPGKENPPVFGPYTSYEEFIDIWYNAALFRAATNRIQPDYNKDQLIILRNFKHIMCSIVETERTPYLYHRDISWGNIIFTEIRTPDGEVCDYEATLIDFEGMCWLPRWMQFSMLVQFTKRDFQIFCFEAAKALEPLNLSMGQWLCDHLLRDVLGSL